MVDGQGWHDFSSGLALYEFLAHGRDDMYTNYCVIMTGDSMFHVWATDNTRPLQNQQRESLLSSGLLGKGFMRWENGACAGAQVREGRAGRARKGHWRQGAAFTFVGFWLFVKNRAKHLITIYCIFTRTHWQRNNCSSKKRSLATTHLMQHQGGGRESLFWVLYMCGVS